MANHKSAIKRAKQSEARRMRNRSRKTRMKTAIKNLEAAIQSKSADVAVERLREAISVIDKTAGHGVIHRNKASRKVSQLTKKVNALQAV
ncbi:MAG: 30S ribosomal protein S20 [Syntrophobacteraceae bacterium]|nr:30S ribosomal protein S20 [Syntrophobacteraceae bacterium]